MAAAADRIIKDLGAYAVPDVSIDERGETVYAFTELAREKAALETYRASLDRRASSLGKTVFDTAPPEGVS
jgi:heme oxygenase